MPLPANRLEVGSGRRSPSRRYHILRAASVMSVWFGVSVVMMVFFYSVRCITEFSVPELS